MGVIRDAERTRKKIIQAAKEEFFEKGYSGARIENIANTAEVTKQLLYRYFKGKDELYEEVMKYMLEEAWNPELFILPANPAHVAAHRFKANVEHLWDFLRFTVWEAIDPGPGNLMGEQRRKQILQSYNADMRSKQEMGLVPKDLDPSLLTLAISSLTIYPLIFGGVTRMLTDKSPEDKEFQEEWAHFLGLLSERIFERKG